MTRFSQTIFALAALIPASLFISKADAAALYVTPTFFAGGIIVGVSPTLPAPLPGGPQDIILTKLNFTGSGASAVNLDFSCSSSVDCGQDNWGVVQSAFFVADGGIDPINVSITTKVNTLGDTVGWRGRFEFNPALLVGDTTATLGIVLAPGTVDLDAGTNLLGLSLEGGTTGGTFSVIPVFAASTAVPIPAAVWLFGSALGVMGWMRRKAAPLRITKNSHLPINGNHADAQQYELRTR